MVDVECAVLEPANGLHCPMRIGWASRGGV
jgi:hypothetical protein